jgi:hypothetical protein
MSRHHSELVVTQGKKKVASRPLVIANSVKLSYITANLEQNPITPPNNICNASEPMTIISEN